MEPDLYAIGTTPEFGIGQRALLVRTPHGNLLWDRVYAAFWDREILAGGKAAVECSRARYVEAVTRSLPPTAPAASLPE